MCVPLPSTRFVENSDGGMKLTGDNEGQEATETEARLRISWPPSLRTTPGPVRSTLDPLREVPPEP